MQLNHLFPIRQKLQVIHGHPDLAPICGTGCTKNPDVIFLFMNPTGKNIATDLKRSGIRAQRLWTKNVWKLFFATNIISLQTFETIKSMKPSDRTPAFSEKLYKEITVKKVYITNLAKCTQIDARPLHNNIFRDYLKYTLQEIQEINPKHIISFGNQVSSILLGRPIKVSEYKENEHEELIIDGKKFKVYPAFYPIGQGMRNMPAAIERINYILK